MISPLPMVLVRPLGSSLTSLNFLFPPINMARLTLISEKSLRANKKSAALLLLAGWVACGLPAWALPFLTSGTQPTAILRVNGGHDFSQRKKRSSGLSDLVSGASPFVTTFPVSR